MFLPYSLQNSTQIHNLLRFSSANGHGTLFGRLKIELLKVHNLYLLFDSQDQLVNKVQAKYGVYLES